MAEPPIASVTTLPSRTFCLMPTLVLTVKWAELSRSRYDLGPSGKC